MTFAPPAKKRPTPARDRARTTLKKLRGIALRSKWSPARIRKELRKRRCACRDVWREAIREVFGATASVLPDLRQMPLFK